MEETSIQSAGAVPRAVVEIDLALLAKGDEVDSPR
jgi:hypothetical protein